MDKQNSDSYTNPLEKVSNGIPFSEKLFLVPCENHKDKIAEYRIFSQYGKSIFLCEKCYQKEQKAQKIQEIKNYHHEEKFISSHAPDEEIFSPSEVSERKKSPTDMKKLEFVLAVIWEDYKITKKGKKCKVFGGKIPAIKIMFEYPKGEVKYFFFSLEGSPLFSTLLSGGIVEFYDIRNW